MAEKFGVDGAFRQSTAVYREILAVSSAAVLMYYFGNVFLADTAFSCNQDSKVGWGYSYGRLQGLVQSRIISDYVESVFDSLQLLCIHI